MITTLGLDFLSRTLRTTGVVLLFCFPFGVYYLGFWPTLAIFSGGVWGLVNLIFLSAVVRSTIRPGGVDKGNLIGFAVIKFPLLYVAGYFLLKVPQFEALNLLIGFSIILAVMILKAVARAILGLDSRSNKTNTLGEAL